MAYVEVVASPVKMFTICSLQDDGVKIGLIEKLVLKVKNQKQEIPVRLSERTGIF